jgi:hypothetical protein
LKWSLFSAFVSKVFSNSTCCSDSLSKTEALFSDWALGAESWGADKSEVRSVSSSESRSEILCCRFWMSLSSFSSEMMVGEEKLVWSFTWAFLNSREILRTWSSILRTAENYSAPSSYNFDYNLSTRPAYSLATLLACSS